MTTLTVQPYNDGDELRLEALGLSTELIHNGLRRGVGRAANRSSFALKTAAGTDIYQDGMEDFAQLLFDAGWRRFDVDGQPRLLHPTGTMSFTISSGINVGNADLRSVPRTRRKGKATEKALTDQHRPLGLFCVDDSAVQDELADHAEEAPLYFLLYERARGGGGVHIELARPASMTEGRSVNAWTERIHVGFLPWDGDLSFFDQPDGDGPSEFDVPVVLR